MFKPIPEYTLVYWDPGSGVFGYFGPDRNVLEMRQHLHNVTIPTLYGQDLLLKEMIDNLSLQVQNNTASTSGEHPLTYLCWAWALISILAVIIWGIYKCW